MRCSVLISAVILIIAATGCSHKQVPTQPELSPTARLMTSTVWQESDVLVLQQADTLPLVITNQFPTPERDDKIEFLEDGTYRYHEGATKHDPNHKEIFVTGTWHVDETRQLLTLTANESSDTYRIAEVTDSTLVLVLPMNTGSKSYSYTLKFKK
jgi:hypothetical protein